MCKHFNDYLKKIDGDLICFILLVLLPIIEQESKKSLNIENI